MGERELHAWYGRGRVGRIVGEGCLQVGRVGLRCCVTFLRSHAESIAHSPADRPVPDML